ncbi:SIR2 family protein [Bradyrhizobium mercantei]|uniref:SIR2 family protein n=1 Tax=Bradyrhizobium mercantei TaxID=1904807 RepID=UPI000977E75F|nr:SIR2 family protein [Bradyrhizobium mercantei]
MTQVFADIQKKDLQSFASLLADLIKRGQSFAFFLGAGCSVSSGVLPASTLTLQWIRELKRHQTGTSLDAEKWYSELHPDFDAKVAGRFYGRVIQERFPNLASRRMEAQRFVSNKDPGFGYVTLAGLMSDIVLGPRTNVAITTNFDDLLYDALHLFYGSRPLTISHEDLFRFALPELKRAIILKLHGDAFLEPRHTELETSVLPAGMSSAATSLLMNRGLVFMGYSGGDRSISSMLQSLPPEALPYGVFWVNTDPPSDAGLARWLEKSGAVWVQHRDFDLAMLAVSQHFGGPRPSNKRFKHLLEDYDESREQLERKAQIKRTSKRFNMDDFISRIRAMMSSDRAAIIAALDDAVSLNPKNATLLGFCAQQKRRLKDNEGAQSLYEAALSVDPDNVQCLCHYASFVLDTSSNTKEFPDPLAFSRSLLRRACASEPYNALALGSYASFSWTRDQNANVAEDYFQRALQADPGNSETLASYANFLWRSEGSARFEEALEYYERSHAMNPASFRTLANYSQLLFLTDDKGRARDYAITALKKAPSDAVRLEAAFYLFCNDRKENRSPYLKSMRALIDAGVRSPHWDLSPTVNQAVSQSHEDAILIGALAQVISHGTSDKGLSGFIAWEKARLEPTGAPEKI